MLNMAPSLYRPTAHYDTFSKINLRFVKEKESDELWLERLKFRGLTENAELQPRDLNFRVLEDFGEVLDFFLRFHERTLSLSSRGV